MAEFYRKLIGVPDALFETLDYYPAETAWEVIQAVRSYVHYFDAHRTDKGFDVSGLSPDGRAVFRTVAAKLRKFSCDYYDIEPSVGCDPCDGSGKGKMAGDIPRKKDVIAADMSALAQEKHATVKSRQKAARRQKKFREKQKKQKALRNQAQILAQQGIAEISAEKFKKSVTKSVSNPCSARDSGDFCDSARVYNNYYLNYTSKDLLDYWKGGVGENQVIHTSVVDKSGRSVGVADWSCGTWTLDQVEGDSRKTVGYDCVGNNPTSGLSGSKAVSAVREPQPFTADSKAVKENGRKGEDEAGKSDRKAVSLAEASSESSAGNMCSVGIAANDAVCAGVEERQQEIAVGNKDMLLPGCSIGVEHDSKGKWPGTLPSAPHEPSETEVFISSDFKLDCADEFFYPYRRMDKFLKRGVENWLINHKLGCSVEKRWVCQLIYKFAQRQGKISLLLGNVPDG